MSPPVDVVRFPLGVAEESGGVGDAIRWADDAHPVAEDEDEVIGRQEVHVATAYAGGGDAVLPRQVEIAEVSTGDVVVGQRNTPIVQRKAVGDEAHAGSVAQLVDDLVHDLAVADDGQDVARDGAVVACRKIEVAGMARLVAGHQPGEAHVAAVLSRELVE